MEILHELGSSEEVDRLKDMVSAVSEYLIDNDLTVGDETPVDIFAGLFGGAESDYDKELVAEIISGLNLNRVSPRSDFNFQYCAGVIDAYKEQFGAYISLVEGLKNIWKRHFGGENRPYDSFGGQLSNYYALARHLLGHKGSCETLVKDLYEVVSAKIEIITSDPRFFEELFEGNPEDQILLIAEDVMQQIGPIIHQWLKADETLPEEQNAETALFIELTFMQLFAAQLDDVYFFVSKKLKRDPIVGQILQFIKDLRIDFRKVASKTSNMMKELGESGICGDEAIEECESMERLRRSYPEPVIASRAESVFLSLTFVFLLAALIFE